jgi:signal transduction histidine kinase
MTTCKYIRFFFGLILLNSIVIISFWSCYNYQGNYYFGIIFLFCLISLLLINFISFYFLAKIVDKSRNFKKIEQDFSNKMEECFKKVAESYNLVEASRISFGVYHDLANILTASSLALEEVTNNFDNHNKLRNLIKKSVFINERAVNLLRSFKRQCQKDGERNNFSLSKEIKRSLSVLNFYFIKNNIELVLKIKDNIEIFGDSIKFSQVVTNLISNAIESFPAKKEDKKIVVVLEKSDNNIVFSVEDNGSGIDEKNLSSIFEPFFSLKKEFKEGHCGVGLALVKKIIREDFSGEILVQSSLGQGSIFQIIFPCNI